MMIAQHEFDLILQKSKSLPPAKGMYLEHDYITNLFLTVLDFQLSGHIVESAIAHYRKHQWNEIRTFTDLKNLLAKYPDDRDGNTAVSLYLWGYRYWNRVSLLRKLITYFESIGITSQKTLSHWAKTGDFERDFKGKIPRMGFAIYKWLVMRQGVETIKPDVHIRHFIDSIIHRTLPDNELVTILEKVAKQLGMKAYELDWRIWEHQRKVK
ncbi:MAG: hypothetical protein U9O41_09190 [Candidatus Aerophobetes bacterium]|nr:hypothetical protein [Candidatus Aerophobetes bacterium]